MSEKIKIMLKEISKNPFRNFEINPIRKEKVERLEKEIADHGHERKLRVRKKGDEYQLVDGHHYLEAMKNLHGDNHEIEVTLGDYSDRLMHLNLVGENDEIWNHSIRDIDEGVFEARKELERMKAENSKEFRDYAQSLFSRVEENKEKQRVSIGAPLISAYLKWPQKKVEESLTRLNAFEEKIIDAHSIYRFPTENSAMTFFRLAKLEKIHLKEQERLAHEIVVDGRFGEKSMQRTMWHFKKYRNTQAGRYAGDETDIEYLDGILKRVTKGIKDAIFNMDRVGCGVDPTTILKFSDEYLPPTIDDFRPQTIEKYHNAVEQFLARVKIVNKHFQKLQENKESEEVTDEIEPPPEEVAKIAMEKDDRKEKERKEEDSGRSKTEMDIAEKVKEKFDKLKKVKSQE